MNKAEFIAAVADAAELSKADAARATDAVIDVIKAALKEMSQGGHEPGGSEKAFVDDLLSALDKNGASDTAMVLSGDEFRDLLSKHGSLVSYCGRRDVAYADVFVHVAEGGLGEVRMDTSGKAAFQSWRESQCVI